MSNVNESIPALTYAIKTTPKGNEAKHTVTLTELLYLRSVGKMSYTWVYFATNQRPELVTHCLAWFEEQNVPGLLRIHRSYLVSQLQISKIIRVADEIKPKPGKRKRTFRIEVELFNKTRLPVAYRAIQPLLDVFGLTTQSFNEVPVERSYSVNTGR